MSAERPELREIASTEDGRDITRGWVEGLALLQPQDGILARAGGLISGYDAYRQILSDWQVAATLQQRRLALLSTETQVIAGGTRRIDQVAADFVREQLLRLPFDQILGQMHHTLFYGFGVAELLWTREGRHLVWDQIRVRDRRRFAYAPNGALKLLTFAQPQGESLPPRNFWHVQTGADHGDEPYGMGLAHWCYWPVLFKRSNIRFWLTAGCSPPAWG